MKQNCKPRFQLITTWTLGPLPPNDKTAHDRHNWLELQTRVRNCFAYLKLRHMAGYTGWPKK